MAMPLLQVAFSRGFGMCLRARGGGFAYEAI